MRSLTIRNACRNFAAKTFHAPFGYRFDVIRAYGILNDQVSPEDGFFYGIPYPGVYVTDEEGSSSRNSFTIHTRSATVRVLIAAAEGKVEIPDDVPQARGGDNEVKLSVGLVGGKGDFRQGILREIVARSNSATDCTFMANPYPTVWWQRG